MTNYVSNHILIFENPEKVNLIIQDIWKDAKDREKEFSFESIVPIPENPIEQGKDWFEKYWGTNQLPMFCWYKIFDNYSILDFDTSWDGVFPLVKALSYKYKVETFYSFWGEGGFWGIYYTNGDLSIRINSGDYKIEPESIINYLAFLSAEKLSIVEDFSRDTRNPIYFGCDSMIKNHHPKFPEMSNSIDLAEEIHSAKLLGFPKNNDEEEGW